MGTNIFEMYECAVCGKKFIPAIGHRYKLFVNHKPKYYCSYTCYRKAGGDGGRKHFTRKSNM